MKRATLMMATLALLLSSVSQTKADVTFDTTPYWNRSSFVNTWGSVQSNATPTYGQTFIAPTGASTLQDFTFYVKSSSGSASVIFQADVYAWTGSLTGGSAPQGATGPALFTSANMTLTYNTLTDNGTFQAVTINTGGVALTPGTAYIALLTTSDPASILANKNSQGGFVFGATSHGSNDGGGGFNYYNNSTSSQLNSSNWHGPRSSFRSFSSQGISLDRSVGG